jgi:hypothetical protein
MTGVHEADIQKQGCGQSDIAEFCSNLTCATKLTDRCGSSASCSGCTKCAGNVRACNDHPVVQSNFCDTSCAQELRCTLKAVELCNPSDITQCAVCTGVNADALHAARCSGDQLESFCKKQLCIPKLANKCSHTNESNGTCLDCAACSQRNRGSTHCRSADEEAYCNLIVPPRKHGPSCRATLEHYCEASRQKGFFECVQCSGKYHRSVLAANCTSQETGAFCKIPYKIASPCLAAIANLCNTSASGAATSSCGTCTSCVTKAAQALYKTGITCPVDELSDFCDSGCPNGTFVWTNNTHDEEQTPHCVVPDDDQQWYLGLNGQSCSDTCAARGDSCATGDKYSEVTDAAMLTGIAKSLVSRRLREPGPHDMHPPPPLPYHNEIHSVHICVYMTYLTGVRVCTGNRLPVEPHLQPHLPAVVVVPVPLVFRQCRLGLGIMLPASFGRKGDVHRQIF